MKLNVNPRDIDEEIRIENEILMDVFTDDIPKDYRRPDGDYGEYSLKKGFGFHTVTNEEEKEGIIIKCKGHSDQKYPWLPVPHHTVEEYVHYINENQLEKAYVVMDDISFLPQCQSLKYIFMVPSDNAPADMDLSPLAEVKQLKYLTLIVPYGERDEKYTSMDFSHLDKLEYLNFCYNKKMVGFQTLKNLKTLSIIKFVGENRDLSDLFCSKQLDTLRVSYSKIQSLRGIEQSDKIQCVKLYYNRCLTDISDLRKIKGTLKHLFIEGCSKIEDFSVLEELENLEYLTIVGRRPLPNIQFLKKLKKLTIFQSDSPIADGDLTPALGLKEVNIFPIKKYYNLKKEDLPHNRDDIRFGLDGIETWRRL